LKEKTMQAFGPVDILVNNAIRIAVSPVEEMDVHLWDQIIQVNLRGTFLTCKAFLPDMVARSMGVIINMVSTEAMPGLSAYIASKQGIAGFSQSLALEVGQDSLKVIPFGPGMVDTPGIESVASDLAPHLGMTRDQFKSVSLHSAYEGFMPPEHAGAAAAYLALRLAGEYHGQLVNGYEVLEKAGIIQPAAVVSVEHTAPSQGPATSGIGKPENLTLLVNEVRQIISETEREFGQLPAFVRPLARTGFNNKSGQSLSDWQRSLEALKNTVETNSLGCGSKYQSTQTLRIQLAKLTDYYQGVPAETARFTRDKALLEQVSRLCTERIAAIRALIEALGEAAE
jgi:hypothetical protein